MSLNVLLQGRCRQSGESTLRKDMGSKVESDTQSLNYEPLSFYSNCIKWYFLTLTLNKVNPCKMKAKWWWCSRIISKWIHFDEQLQHAGRTRCWCANVSSFYFTCTQCLHYKISSKLWIIATFCIILLSWECMVKHFLTELQANITTTVVDSVRKRFAGRENISPEVWDLFLLTMVFCFSSSFPQIFLN